MIVDGSGAAPTLDGFGASFVTGTLTNHAGSALVVYGTASATTLNGDGTPHDLAALVSYPPGTQYSLTLPAGSNQTVRHWCVQDSNCT